MIEWLRNGLLLLLTAPRSSRLRRSTPTAPRISRPPNFESWIRHWLLAALELGAKSRLWSSELRVVHEVVCAVHPVVAGSVPVFPSLDPPSYCRRGTPACVVLSPLDISWCCRRWFRPPCCHPRNLFTAGPSPCCELVCCVFLGSRLVALILECL